MLFLIGTVIVFNTIAILIPKKMVRIEILTNILFGLFLQLITDVYLGLKYDFYGYFEEGVDWNSLFYVFGIYPAVITVFLNFFPYRKKWKTKLLYLGFWILFAYAFEFLFIWSGTFYYSEWRFLYSAILYPFLYLILVCFNLYVKRLLREPFRD